MNYFMVFQNKTYNEERQGGYLWAPMKTSAGREKYHWSNMTKINEGEQVRRRSLLTRCTGTD
ncbi:hypothetical protein [Clostridium grantii]|uniref:Uncharacterized protein n=1 Tax=Clostridium grantii DSM 8605 TaxID=1121316 RepID=A0A1M5RD03_9CLOT|nr:hypothetical protein [Clostridium grantii]SHH24020.1 hypothetical protein SAMN02745207_00456 [Clostridium grantii DSM 8605]